MIEPRFELTAGAAAKGTPRGESTLSSDVLDLLAAIRDALDVPAPALGTPGGYNEMQRIMTSRAAAVRLAAKVAVKMGTPHWGVLAESVREATESIPVDYEVHPGPTPDADGGR